MRLPGSDAVGNAGENQYEQGNVYMPHRNPSVEFLKDDGTNKCKRLLI